MRTLKKYVLDDGQKITAHELAGRLNLTLPTARARLQQSRDPAIVFKDMTKRYYANPAHFFKVTLDDGSEVDSIDVAEAVGITFNSARTRLCKYTDPRYVFAKKHQKIFAEDLLEDLAEETYSRKVIWGIPIEDDSEREKDKVTYSNLMHCRNKWVTDKGGDDFFYDRDDEDLMCSF